MGFYTYLYLREDGSPYYVGKGQGHRAFSKNRCVAVPTDRSRILIQEFPTEADAYAAEIFLIAFYGREDLGQGRLLNRTDGGDCPPPRKGCKPNVTDAMREKLAARAKATWAEKRGVMLAAVKLARSSVREPYKPIGNKWHLGRKRSAETIARLSASHAGKPWSAARRAAQN